LAEKGKFVAVGLGWVIWTHHWKILQQTMMKMLTYSIRRIRVTFLLWQLVKRRNAWKILRLWMVLIFGHLVCMLMGGVARVILVSTLKLVQYWLLLFF